MRGGQSQAPCPWSHPAVLRAVGTGGPADGWAHFHSSAVPLQWRVAVQLLYCALALLYF